MSSIGAIFHQLRLRVRILSYCRPKNARSDYHISLWHEQWPEFWNFAALTWPDSGVKKQTSSKAFIKTEILNPALSLTPPFTLLEHEKTRNIAFKNLLDVWIHAMIKQCTRSPKRLSYAKLKGWTKIQIWSQIFLFKTIFLDGVPLYFKTFLVIQVKKNSPLKMGDLQKKQFSQKIQ